MALARLEKTDRRKVQLQNAIAVITGGGSGIGKAIAQSLADRGASVVVCGRRSDPLAETVRLIERKMGKAFALPMDVRDWSQVSATVNRVLDRFGRIDILVNNAGIAMAKPMLETTEADWDEIIDINLKGVFLCCKAVLPTMTKTGDGVIVNVSSILGMTGTAKFGAYCASKFGVIGLTQVLAEELKPHGIRVYAVCPGPTDTDLHRKIVGQEAARKATPPEKVAARVISLVTGEIILASGAVLMLDESSFRFGSNKAKRRWRKAAKQWLEPASLLLNKIKGLLT